jgi:hypothetical protein
MLMGATDCSGVGGKGREGKDCSRHFWRWPSLDGCFYDDAKGSAATTSHGPKQILIGDGIHDSEGSVGRYYLQLEDVVCGETVLAGEGPVSRGERKAACGLDGAYCLLGG